MTSPTRCRPTLVVSSSAPNAPLFTIRSLASPASASAACNMLYIFSLSQDSSRTIKTKNCVKLTAAHSGFDAKLTKGELWVAAALWPDTTALFRVVGDRAEEPLPPFLYEYPQLPHFFGDNLLVCRWPAAALPRQVLRLMCNSSASQHH